MAQCYIRKAGPALIMFSVIFCLSCQKQPISLPALLQTLSEQDHLSYYPRPAYRLKQASSYDRRSILPGTQDWFANEDYTRFIRLDTSLHRPEYVMLESEGPGAVVRWWMTFAGEGARNGVLRIYIDYDTIPVIQDNVLHFMAGQGKVPYPLAAKVAPQSDTLHHGYNLYWPLLFAKHLKITLENRSITERNGRMIPSIYYNINYRLYEPGVKVISYQVGDLERWKSMLEGAAQLMLFPENTAAEINNIMTTVHPGDTYTYRITGTKAISSLWIKPEVVKPPILRQLVIGFTFDQEKEVWCPVGDFFGTGYQLSPYQTLYSQVDSSGRLSFNRLLPFRDSAILKIQNLSDEPVTLEGQVKLQDYQWTDRSMYFGVNWQLYHRQPAFAILNPQPKDQGFDFQVTQLAGKGVYLGDVMTLFNTEDAWWGEGDEKIWVDGDTFPSHFGTGTEDYYGYAWARPEEFSHPLMAQPSGKGNFHPGMTVNVRHRWLDGIPFNTSLKVDLECLHWVATPLDVSLTAFYYRWPGASMLLRSDILDVKKPLALVKEDILLPEFNDQGWLEGEHLKTIPSKGVSMQTQYFWPGSMPLSNGGHLWVQAEALNQMVHLEFWMDRDTVLSLELGLTKAVDYAVIQLAINGGNPLKYNGYQPKGIGRDRLIFAPAKLTKGKNRLQVKFTGKDPASKPGLMAGIDYLKWAVH